MPPAKLFALLGAVNAALAVALGAFGAHALKMHLAPDLLAIYQTGVQYHFYHALGLIAVGLAAAQWPQARGWKVSGGLMQAGIILFAGSLYALALTGNRAFGAITPLGGMALIAAWMWFAVSLKRR